MASVEQEFRRWKEARSGQLGVDLLRVEDGSTLVIAFTTGGAGSHVATVALAPIEGSSFLADGLDEPPDEVEAWLTDVNAYMSEKPGLSLGAALDAMLHRAPRSLGLAGEEAGGAAEEDPEMEGDDDDEVLGDEDDGPAAELADVEAAEDRKRQRMDFQEEQRWESMVSSSSSQGTRQASQVLMREMRRLLALQSDDKSAVLEIEMVNDSFYRWCVKMHADGFPDGCALKEELRRFALQHPSGTAAVVMDVLFPDNYPMAPPFIRVVRPRFHQHTGHITIGGSVCMQLLSTSGWLPSVSLENVFVSIRCEMIEGGGRIDFQKPHRDYTVAEAREAFSRVASRYGWM